MTRSGGGDRPARDGEAGWLEANQRFLAAAVETVRCTLADHLDPAGGERAARARDTLEQARDQLPGRSALDELVAAFSLSPFEREVLVLCAAVELDGEVAALCGRALGAQGRAAPCFSLALAALPDPEWRALLPTGPLRYWQLVALGAGATVTSAPLRIAERGPAPPHRLGLPGRAAARAGRAGRRHRPAAAVAGAPGRPGRPAVAGDRRRLARAPALRQGRGGRPLGRRRGLPAAGHGPARRRRPRPAGRSRRPPPPAAPVGAGGGAHRQRPVRRRLRRRSRRPLHPERVGPVRPAPPGRGADRRARAGAAARPCDDQDGRAPAAARRAGGPVDQRPRQRRR